MVDDREVSRSLDRIPEERVGQGDRDRVRRGAGAVLATCGRRQEQGQEEPCDDEKPIANRATGVVTTHDQVRAAVSVHVGDLGRAGDPSDQEHLLRHAVRAAAAEESVLSPPIARQLLGQVRSPHRDKLSERELEILVMVARGTTNKLAAAELLISEATVKTHLLHIYEKLGVNDRAAAVAAAYERGLLTPGDAGSP